MQKTMNNRQHTPCTGFTASAMQENEKKNALEQKEGLNDANLEKVTGGRIRHMSPEKDLSDEDREKLTELERQIADRM